MIPKDSQNSKYVRNMYGYPCKLHLILRSDICNFMPYKTLYRHLVSTGYWIAFLRNMHNLDNILRKYFITITTCSWATNAWSRLHAKVNWLTVV